MVSERMYKIRKGKYAEENVETLRKKLAEEGTTLEETAIDGQPYYRWEGLASQKQSYLDVLQPEVMDRRTAIRRVGAGIIVGVASAVGVGGVLTYLGSQNVSKTVEGEVIARGQANIDGDLVYYRDSCHTVDSGTDDGELLSFIIDRDAKFRCTSRGALSGDFVLFLMWSDDVYHAGNRRMQGRDIFSKIKLDDQMGVEKGEKIDKDQYYAGKIVKAPWL